MAELPEVEAICSRARRHCIERRIKGIRVLRGRYLQNQVDLVVGRWIKEVYRRGKYILFELMDIDAKTTGFMQCHNAMSGYWDYTHEPWTFDYVEGKRVSRQSDVRVEIDLDPGGSILRFHDSRLFGRIIHTTELPAIGPEALMTERLFPGSPIMKRLEFQNELHRCHGAIKPTIMNQLFMGGVGNIYATEACGWAGIRPDKMAGLVSLEKTALLFDTIQELLSFNIPEIRYNWLRFYRKKVCTECKTAITRIEQEGRKTWLCPTCQT